jgi:hypothetical protein
MEESLSQISGNEQEKARHKVARFHTADLLPLGFAEGGLLDFGLVLAAGAGAGGLGGGGFAGSALDLLALDFVGDGGGVGHGFFFLFSKFAGCG